jgi:uncharacterized protein (TIGR03435 family)
MLRTMMVERFGLKFHRETRETPAYILMQGKGKVDLASPDLERLVDTPIGPRRGTASRIGGGHYISTSTTIELFVMQVNTTLDCPLIDQSGLKGRYFIELQWDPTDPLGILGAIQSQLGLKVEKRKVPYEYFIVDSINVVPTAN